MSDDSDFQVRTRTAGQVIFVTTCLALCVLLLLSIRGQTVWVADNTLAAQPRFWPAVALLVMVGGFGFHLSRMRRRRPNRADWDEVRIWLKPLEFMGWFMAFVFTVPIVGFLPMSVLFAVGLTWRLGYRSRDKLLLAALFGVAVVVVFKGLLGVKIPGAALYEYLPGEIRSFFLVYL